VLRDISVGRYRHQPPAAGLPFNLGWCSCTFPIGVYAVATLRLSSIFPLSALASFGEGLVAALAAI
jgi:tellurite resistance protein TehA-like permease